MLGKRRFKKAVMGIIVPVMAKTHRKKKSQRGPTVGRVVMIKVAKPPQPIMNNKMEAGRKLATRGDEFASILT